MSDERRGVFVQDSEVDLGAVVHPAEGEEVKSQEMQVIEMRTAETVDDGDGMDGDEVYIPTEYSLQESVRDDWRLKIPTVPVPLEVNQLKSRDLQFYFRLFFTFACVFALVILVSFAYISKRKTKFLALERNAGNCDKVLIETVTGDFFIDKNGYWSTSDQFETTDTYLRVKLTAVPADEYSLFMEKLSEAFDIKAKEIGQSYSLMQNVLLGMTYKATYRGEKGGIGQAWIETSADVLLSLSSMNIGATGCPPAKIYGDDRTTLNPLGYRDTFPDFIYETDIQNFDGYTKIAWTADAVATCIHNPDGFSMADWLESIIKFGSIGNYPSEPSEHESFNLDWFSVVAAAAINAGEVQPADFMTELDANLFAINSRVSPSIEVDDIFKELDYYSFMNNGYQCNTLYQNYQWFRNISGARNSSVYLDDTTLEAWVQCPTFNDGFRGRSSRVNETMEYNVRYFADTDRKPNMQPLACTWVDTDDIGWVCSIVNGGAHAYPIIFHHLDKCNHCESEQGLSYINYNTQECLRRTQLREYYGGVFFKPNLFGPFTNHPYSPKEAFKSSSTLDTATLTKFIAYEVGYASVVFESCYFYYSACPVVDWPDLWFVGFNNFEQSQPLSIVNDFGFINRFENWHCTSTFMDTAVTNLEDLIHVPPIDLDETFLKCKPSATSAFIASLGESEGNVQIFLIILSIIMTQGVITWLHKNKPHYFHGNILIRQDQIDKTNIVQAANREYHRRSTSSLSGRDHSTSRR